MTNFNIHQSDINTSNIITDQMMAQNILSNSMISQSIASRQVLMPDVWTFPVTVGGPILNALGLERGSTELVGNLDMSPQTGSQTFPSGGGTVWQFGVIPTESYGGVDTQIRVIVTPANVEATRFDYWVSDEQSAITVQPTMSEELQARASQPNAGFIINLQNNSGSPVSNPNFNYFVTTHPLTWKT